MSDIPLRDKIFEAAVEEFAEKGYKMASTNAIMQKAGVSKGLIFHYFGNKERLYVECAKYIFDEYIKNCLAAIDYDETDFFERCKKFTDFKLHFAEQHPVIRDMILDVYEITFEHIIPELEEHIKEVRERFYGAYFKNIDTSRYRNPESAGKIHLYMLMTIESYSSMFVTRYKSYREVMCHMDECISELEDIYELLKYGIYKS